MKVQIKKASRQGLYLKMALMGPTGSGKTYSALGIAEGLGSRICVLDTERGSASLYSDKFDFSVVDDLPDYHPQNYIDVMKAVVAEGFDVLVIDSLTHAWNGKGGILEIVDDLTANSRSKNAYTTGWPTGTRLQNELLDCILTSPIHIIVTMRSKMDYVLQDDGHGKKTPVKVGLAPVQRDGVEYEFTIIGDLNLNHSMAITKTRLVDLDGRIIKTPGPDFGAYLKEWLGTPVAPVVPQAKPAEVLSASSRPDPQPSQFTAPAKPATPAPVSQPAPEDAKWEAAYNRVSNMIQLFREWNINGYGDLDKVRNDIKYALGIERLRDASLEQLEVFEIHLRKLKESSSTPFEHTPPAQPAQPVQEAAPVASQPVPAAQNVLVTMEDVDYEISRRVINATVGRGLRQSCADALAEGKPEKALKFLEAIQAYSIKKPEADPRVKELQHEIEKLIAIMVAEEIDSFHISKRMSSSVFEHLGVKKVSSCDNVALLEGYLNHLTSIMEAAA